MSVTICKALLFRDEVKECKSEIWKEWKKGYMERATFNRIYDVVKQIPYGKVATYGLVAALAGSKRWARVVGYALHVNPDPENIPCYRVVNRFGEVSKAFAFGGENRQIELLEAEGIEFVDGRVILDKYQWNQVTMDMIG